MNRIVVKACGTDLSLDIDKSSLSIRSHHITQLWPILTQHSVAIMWCLWHHLCSCLPVINLWLLSAKKRFTQPLLITQYAKLPLVKNPSWYEKNQIVTDSSDWIHECWFFLMTFSFNLFSFCGCFHYMWIIHFISFSSLSWAAKNPYRTLTKWAMICIEDNV